MKKIIGLMLIAMFCSTMIYAQNITSLSSDATYGLFLNEMDAAANINETPRGPGFTDLESDYLFAGISGNIEGMNDGGFSPVATMGYYRAADMPWSLFMMFDFSAADYFTAETKSSTTYPNAATSEKITLEQKVPLYDIINTSTQFLMNFGVASSGLKLDLRLDNNMVPANNYEGSSTVVGSAGSQTEMDKGGSILGMTFTAPFFMETEGMRHYAHISYEFDRTNRSTSDDIKSADGTFVQADSTTDITTDSKIEARYELTIPFMAGELSPFVRIAKNGTKYTYETDDKTTTAGTTTFYKEERTQDYKGGMEFQLGSNYYMDLRPGNSWLKFRLNPWTYYQYMSSPYVESTSIDTDTNGVTTANSTDGAVNHFYNHEISLGLNSGAEIKPENWFIGFQMGSRIHLNWDRRINETKVASSTTGGTTIEGRDESKIIQYTDWFSTVRMRYGFFVPLPDDYRLDFSLNSNDLFDFEDVTVQLIVPLN